MAIGLLWKGGRLATSSGHLGNRQGGGHKADVLLTRLCVQSKPCFVQSLAHSDRFPVTLKATFSSRCLQIVKKFT